MLTYLINPPDFRVRFYCCAVSVRAVFIYSLAVDCAVVHGGCGQVGDELMLVVWDCISRNFRKSNADVQKQASFHLRRRNLQSDWNTLQAFKTHSCLETTIFGFSRKVMRNFHFTTSYFDVLYFPALELQEPFDGKHCLAIGSQQTTVKTENCILL